MKFRVERTSDWEGKARPCPGAVKGRVEGRGGQIQHWTMEVASLEDLVAFAHQPRPGEGEPDTRSFVCVIYEVVAEDGTVGSLEIYDGYRE